MLLLEHRSIRFNTHDEKDMEYYREHKNEFLKKKYLVNENNPDEYVLTISNLETGYFDVLDRSWDGKKE